MHLYWVTTPDGYENWFAVAKSKRAAEKFHESAEGYGENYAEAEFVCKVPIQLIQKLNPKSIHSSGFWPSHELLEALGGRLETVDNPRRVNFNGKIYIEGTFTEGMLFDEIKDASGVYVIQIQNTEKYKIGITINLKRRIKQFSTGNPFNIKLVYFIQTKHYKSLEKHLHGLFGLNRSKGEWFNFNDEALNEFEIGLTYLHLKAPSQFKFYNIKGAAIKGGGF